MLKEGNKIHYLISSYGSGTVINYGFGSDFLTSYCSGTVINYGFGSDFLTSYGSGSDSQKVTVPAVTVPQHCRKVLACS